VSSLPSRVLRESRHRLKPDRPAQRPHSLEKQTVALPVITRPRAGSGMAWGWVERIVANEPENIDVSSPALDLPER